MRHSSCHSGRNRPATEVRRVDLRSANSQITFQRERLGIATQLVYYDGEYREDDANFEACFPVCPGKPVQSKDADITIRELPGGRCLSLLHRGPYEDLGQSHARLFDHLRQKGYTAQLPSREVYLKGPGMIFKGNPKKYLTEIQVLVE